MPRHPVAPTITGVEITRIYADADGQTHFGTERIELTSTDIAPPARPLAVSAPRPADAFLVVHAAADWIGEAHPAPARLLQIMVRGTIEVTTSDGETRRFAAGDALLAEDTRGVGHTTRAVGGEATSIAVRLA